MDRERLTALLDDPARVRRDDIADLKAMADRYPWFSAAHLLLAVGGHREGDVLFDEQLRASAARRRWCPRQNRLRHRSLRRGSSKWQKPPCCASFRRSLHRQPQRKK